MSELPGIAVVTPSFDAVRYISSTIQSVLDQEYPRLDYLVMDGGSLDGTSRVLESFGSRIRFVSRKDQGQADAIRTGFEQTHGEILTWLNADDTFAPGALNKVAAFFAAHPDVALVYGNANYIDAAGRVIAPCVHIEPFNPRRLYHYSDFIVQPAAFFRRSAYEAVGGLDPTLHYGMDYDLWIKLARQFKVAYLPEHLANYRWLTDNKTALGGFRRIDELAMILQRHGFTEPAYVRLERVNLLLQESRSSLRKRELGRSMRSCFSALGNLAASPRAMLSLLQPRTWKIIWTGQVLRARAARAHAGLAE